MAQDIGKAYVQIVPSAEGIEGSITNLLGGEAKKAGNSSGETFGSGMVSKIKTLIAAAGLGTILKEAISAGADLQQSFGGLDTLYGEASDAAKKFASEAAKAGISANDYAEQAVSFGASLKQAFKGDVTKAAEAANTAILDMTDNAAKMGTDIGSIQNAYQGFAKQNYTMLDNLKLGYGGTKTEMQRLLSDATKLSGIKYDINNLGDVYSAIHVIQEELGMSGVAAQEAQETISGSLGAMKASFTNVLANLTLGEDIGPSLKELVSTTSNFLFKNLIPAVINIVKQLPPALYKLVKDYYPTLSKTVNEIVTNFVTYISNNLPTIVNKGFDVLNSLVNGILQKLPSIASSAIQIIGQLARSILENLPTILQKGIEITGKIAAGIIQAIPSLFSSVKNAFASIDWLSIGSNIISGIVNGLRNGISAVADAAKSVAKNAFNAAKDWLGIKSPSRKFRYIGEMTSEGLADGIADNSNLVRDAMGNITSMMTDSVSPNLTTSYRVGAGVSAAKVGGGFNQVINNYSPKALSASEVARQTRNSTKQLALKLSMGG